MSENAPSSPFSAAEQGLGYIYQARLALLKLLSFPESSCVFIEKDDDVELLDEAGRPSLASLKHKAVGETLTDLSPDFWKSVRIWLTVYNRDGRIASGARFFLFTTAAVANTSLLSVFLEGAKPPETPVTTLMKEVLEKSTSKTIIPIREELGKLEEQEFEDFLSRVVIFDRSPRITEVPQLIVDQHLRTVRREVRPFVFERLEGWWINRVIEMLSGKSAEGVFGYEVSDKLLSFAEEYRSDNLPITFRNKVPDSKIDAESDPRLFVEQLRFIGLNAIRIQRAIVDYYRAFEQRSSWARENLLISGEIEEYEDRLVDEWSRYKEVIFERLDDDSGEEACIAAGRELYKWAEFETDRLRIRERVTEPYVVRGCFHILANVRPTPRVFWHPRFLKRLEELFTEAVA
ncbi:hypothetical protein OGR47_02860 [Methylocystis sp. MJC1]|uniref:ABC-three component system protein n=1 Tax=Methylocystis sp. MJC1 TaxID=2654282 RepID=UPI0013EBD965|nr:ABC-three component system protein [Methylocystis sp. MJC1]KAF2991123.1 hypothetical protein MJC1_01856 [Methylocystis sp. MJC1]MBU6525954.1 hypothetical protein [Methylocystis sp. MJC1]UZX12421.1 hypothetical protein OGR47_02860 [Methylocystis sp. MJC1]